MRSVERHADPLLSPPGGGLGAAPHTMFHVKRSLRKALVTARRPGSPRLVTVNVTGCRLYRSGSVRGAPMVARGGTDRPPCEAPGLWRNGA